MSRTAPPSVNDDLAAMSDYVDTPTRSIILEKWTRRLAARNRLNIDSRTARGVIAVLTIALFFFLLWFFELERNTRILIVVPLMAVALGAERWIVRQERRGEREVFREVLLEMGICPLRCFRCGYDLRGSESDECPECGEVLVNPTTQD